VGFGTNNNENLHKQLNCLLYGTRVISLEVLLARLTTFFFEYNRRKQGGGEEAWKTKIHGMEEHTRNIIHPIFPTFLPIKN
jgi:hypothetical protein